MVSSGKLACCNRQGHVNGEWCCGAGSSQNAAIIEMIAEASSPEEAARLGRRHQRLHPAAMRPDWDLAKLQVMLAALRNKVSSVSCTAAAVADLGINA